MNALAIPSDALLILGCDGVVVDSMSLVDMAVAAELRRYGLGYSTADISRLFFGLTPTEIQAHVNRDIIPPGAPPLNADFCFRVEIALEQYASTPIRVIPNLCPILDQVPLVVCLAVYAGAKRVADYLAQADVEHYFKDRAFVIEPGSMDLTSIDALTDIVQFFETTPDKVYVVDQRLTTLEAARAVGAHAIAFCGNNICSPYSAFDFVTVRGWHDLSLC